MILDMTTHDTGLGTGLVYSREYRSVPRGMDDTSPVRAMGMILDMTAHDTGL